MEPLIFNEAVLSEGFTYDSDTGTFTAVNPGLYHFWIRVDLDDGGLGVVPRLNMLELTGIPRPSDSRMSCSIPAGGLEYPCSVSFIMEFSSPNQPFTLVNTNSTTAYFGTYDGDPFVKSLEMAVFQLE